MARSFKRAAARKVREREALERYLEQLEQSDEQDEVVIDSSAVASALEKLRQHPEPEVLAVFGSMWLVLGASTALAYFRRALGLLPQITPSARSLEPPLPLSAAYETFASFSVFGSCTAWQ